MRYFVAKEHMDLWKILFFDNFQDERNARPYTDEELDSHTKTRKIKLAFTEPTVEEQKKVPQDTILIYIPNAKISTNQPSTMQGNNVELRSRFFNGLFGRNETFSEYILDVLRSEISVTRNHLNFAIDLASEAINAVPCRYKQFTVDRYRGVIGPALYSRSGREFNKVPTEGIEISMCERLDSNLIGIENTTPAITKFYQSFLLHNCRKHPYLATTAACCLVLAVGFALSSNEKIASFFSSIVERSK